MLDLNVAAAGPFLMSAFVFVLSIPGLRVLAFPKTHFEIWTCAVPVQVFVVFLLSASRL